MMSTENANATGRPTVLGDLSATQAEELERQFAEGDRQGWNRLCESYGWSPEQGQAVWEWFSQRPDPAPTT